MSNKWEWIRDKCCEIGAKNAAYLADEINELLIEIYKVTEVMIWSHYYKCIESKYHSYEDRVAKVSYIINIAENRELCVACNTDKECNTCRFGKIVGICKNDGSLYSRFIHELCKSIDIGIRDVI